MPTKGGRASGAGGDKGADNSTAPTEPAATPEQNSSETVAPQDQPKSDRVIGRLRDILKNDQVTPELLRDLNMGSKEELEQFVDKFTKAPQADPGSARDIKAAPGKAQAIDPNRTLPDLTPGAEVSSQAVRNRGGVIQDTVRGNKEGVRFVPPPELRAGFEAYTNSLARPRTSGSGAGRRPAASPGVGQGSGGR